MNLEEIKNQLRKQVEEELQSAKQTLKELEEQLEDKPDTGLGEGGTGVMSWEMALARRERTEQQIEELQQTLADMKSDDYGYCKNCGAAIEPERLEILPTTQLCAACAMQQS